MNDWFGSSCSRRIVWVDYAKCLGMILIIWGHFFPPICSEFIYAVNVPLFFLLSGYLFKDCGFKILLQKNIRTLLVPYFIFALLNLSIRFILGRFHVEGFGQMGGKGLLTSISGILLGRHIGCGQLWFVYALFWIKLMSHFANKNGYFRILAVCLAIALMWGVQTFLDDNIAYLFAPLTCLAVAFLFFELGKYVKEMGLIERASNWAIPKRFFLIAFLGLLFYFSIHGNGIAFLLIGKCGDSLCRFAVGSLAGCAAIIFSLRIIVLRVRRFVYLCAVGSIVILALHSWLITASMGFIQMCGSSLYVVIVSFLLSIIILLVHIPVIIVIKRYMPIIIGQR